MAALFRPAFTETGVFTSRGLGGDRAVGISGGLGVVVRLAGCAVWGE